MIVPGHGGIGRGHPAGDVVGPPAGVVSSAHVFQLKKHDWVIIISINTNKLYCIALLVRRELLIVDVAAGRE